MTLSLPALLRSMAGIAAANGLGQIIFILISFILTRLIEPADMGFFGHFMTLAACGSLLASLGSESGIVGAPTRHSALLLTGSVFYISAIGASVVTLAYAGLQASGIIEAHLDAGMLALAALTILFGNTYYAFQFAKARSCDYRALARGGFFNNALRGVGQLALAATKMPGAHALIAGETLARGIAILAIARVYDIRAALALPLRFAARAWRQIRSATALSLHFLSANVLEALLFWMPVLLFGHLYGLATAGYVALVARLFSGPVQIISRAVADVYHGQAQKHLADPHTLKRLTLTMWGGIIVVAALMPIAFWILGEKGFALLFGPKWGGVCDVAIAMSPLLGAQLLAPVATRFSLVRNLVRIRLVYVGACLAVAAAFYSFGHTWFPAPQHGIAAYAGIILLLCLVYLVYLARHFSITGEPDAAA